MLSIRQRIRFDTDDDDNNIITLDISCLMYVAGTVLLFIGCIGTIIPLPYASSGETNCVQLAAHVIASVIYIRVYIIIIFQYIASYDLRVKAKIRRYIISIVSIMYSINLYSIACTYINTYKHSDACTR